MAGIAALRRRCWSRPGQDGTREAQVGSGCRCETTRHGAWGPPRSRTLGRKTGGGPGTRQTRRMWSSCSRTATRRNENSGPTAAQEGRRCGRTHADSSAALWEIYNCNQARPLPWKDQASAGLRTATHVSAQFTGGWPRRRMRACMHMCARESLQPRVGSQRMSARRLECNHGWALVQSRRKL
jgi:hypothetical protein